MPRCCSPIGRPIGSPPFDTRITRPWSRARQFPISRSERRASSAATPPGPREAGAHGYPGTPDRRPLGAWPNCRPCAECSPPKFIGGLSQTAMGVTLALVPRPRYGVSASLWCRAFRFWAVIPPRRRDSRRPVLAQTAATLQVSTPRGLWVVLRENVPEFDAPPGSWRLSRRDAMVRAVLCWRRLQRPSRYRPPGSGLFCRKTGSNLTPFRGSGRLFRFLAAIRVDVYGITPGQKHSHRRCPVPQPTKPPRPLLVR